MKLERAAPERYQHTELANGDIDVFVLPGGLAGIEAAVTLECEAHAKARSGKPYSIRVTLTQSELERAGGAIREAVEDSARREAGMPRRYPRYKRLGWAREEG